MLSRRSTQPVVCPAPLSGCSPFGVPWNILFSPARQELRFRVSANIAAYLKLLQARLELHRHVMKLYDARSGVAHGATLNAADAWKESYTLASRVLHRMLAACHVPSKEDLERELLAPLLEPR